MNLNRNNGGFDVTRRQMVRSLVSGSILLPGILSQLLAQSARGEESESAGVRGHPHFPGKAKRVIFLYMTGGVSHLDTFDPKEKLIRQTRRECHHE